MPDFVTTRLQEAVYATGGRTRIDLSGLFAAETNTNTPAGTHDSVSSTKDKATGAQGGFNLTYGVVYTFAPPAFDDIRSVTFVIRAKQTFDSADPGTLWAASQDGPFSDPQALTTSFTTYEFEALVDPVTNLPWTADSLTTSKWGFSAVVDAIIGTAGIEVSEISLITKQA